jgi:hypothetical protein
VLLGSQITAQAPGLEMFAADSVNASSYASAAAQNNQSVPANINAAANDGAQSDVPAYSQPQSTPSASASSGSPSSSPPSSRAAKRTSSSSATTPGTSSSSSNPPYGLTTCPY